MNPLDILASEAVKRLESTNFASLMDELLVASTLLDLRANVYLPVSDDGAKNLLLLAHASTQHGLQECPLRPPRKTRKKQEPLGHRPVTRSMSAKKQ